MKPLYILTILGVLLVPNKIFAQETIAENINIDNKGRPIYFNHIKLNVAGLAFGHYGLIYERKLAKRISVQLDFDIVSYNQKFEKDQTVFFYKFKESFDWKLTGFGIQPEIRYYYGQNAMRGFFIGGFLVYRDYNADVINTKTENIAFSPSQLVKMDYSGPSNITLKHIGGGVVFGAQFLIKEKVSIGFHLGASVGKVDINQPATFNITGSNSSDSTSTISNGSYSDLYKKDDDYEIRGSATVTNNSQVEFTGTKTYFKKDIPPVMPRFGITVGYLFGK